MGGAVAGVSGTDSAGAPRPKGRPGRKPKGSVPVVIPETPDKPDPNHVLTWRQRKVLQVIRESVQQRGRRRGHHPAAPGQPQRGHGRVARSAG